MKTVLNVFLQAIAITAASAVIALTANALRSDGIPAITDVPYEIFAPCKDSEVEVEKASVQELSEADSQAVLYVDARPKDVFSTNPRVKGAVNIPYSPLFGASEAELAQLKSVVQTRAVKTIIVYGMLIDPASPKEKVELASLLAQQLIEAEFTGVKHIEGGMEKLKTAGVEIENNPSSSGEQRDAGN